LVHAPSGLYYNAARESKVKAARAIQSARFESALFTATHLKIDPGDELIIFYKAAAID
jgi:hypothetical protein